MPGSQQNKARRQLAAILSADAVGYSRRMAEDEAATAQVLRSHRDTIAGYVREHRGRVVNAVGDNLLAEFASAVDAVACALDVQTELARREAGLAESDACDYIRVPDGLCLDSDRPGQCKSNLRPASTPP